MPEDELTSEEMRKINREIMNTRGDLLFSRYIVLFEGETEEQALPAFAKMHWGLHPYELGISFVGVGGAGGYTPFLRLAERFAIPWCILSDGKADEVEQMNTCLERAKLSQHPGNKQVFVVPGNTDFEGYITQASHLDLIRAMFLELADEEHLLNEKARTAIREKLAKKSQPELEEQLRSRKTVHAARIAAAYAKHSDPEARVPQLIRELLDFVRPPTVASEPVSGDGSCPLA